MSSRRATRSFASEAKRLLKKHGLSVRAAAIAAEVDRSHLWRVIHGEKPPSAELCRRLAKALELPEDYFPEYREAVVVERIRDDRTLRDRLYDELNPR